MARKGRSTEEIIAALREAEVRLGQGETVGKICRGLGVSEQTYYKWRREYSGLKLDQAKRLKELERENERLKKGKRPTNDLAAWRWFALDELGLRRRRFASPAARRSKGAGPRYLRVCWPAAAA